MINNFHQFHIVTASPWPILASTIVWSIASNAVALISGNIIINPLTIIWIGTTIVAAIWWNDTLNESSNEGEHQNIVSNGLNIGIVIFITSEVIFFLSFFWSYFHSGMSPALEVGQEWPPNGVNSFEPTNVPLLNTLILISSGVSVTWAHHCLINNLNKNSMLGIIITCALGVYFSGLQYMEYNQGEFSIADSSYGTIFFVATGFHGIHVIVGSVFLIVTTININNLTVTNTHHNSFEIAAWYWHFVDIVWLFLYLSIYWWGN